MWKSEAEMAAVLIAKMKLWGFSVYPESCGHDIIFRFDAQQPSRMLPKELCLGDTIAVEAKLRPNLTVLRQATPPRYGPAADFYAVVVPKGDPDFREVAHSLEIAVWVQAAEISHFYLSERQYGLPPLNLPPAVDMAAGLPAPRSVSAWKVDACRLCLKGLRGELRTSDFKTTKVNPRTFLDRGWMTISRKEGRQAVYTLLDAFNRPDLAYPEIVAALLRQEK